MILDKTEYNFVELILVIVIFGFIIYSFKSSYLLVVIFVFIGLFMIVKSLNRILFYENYLCYNNPIIRSMNRKFYYNDIKLVYVGGGPYESNKIVIFLKKENIKIVGEAMSNQRWQKLESILKNKGVKIGEG